MTHADFVHLRVHSAYSLSEGALKVKELVKLCVGQAMPAVAIADTGNLFGALEFAGAAAEAGVQPIIGCQLGLRRSDGGGRPGGPSPPGSLAICHWSRPTKCFSPTPACTRRTTCCCASPTARRCPTRSGAG